MDTTKLLIVDDDPNICDMLRLYFENEGYRVKTACDGMEGISYFKSFEPDLVLLDIMMPKVDGYEFTSAIREVNNTLPILMVSAKQLPEDKKKGFLVGTDDYMTKPVDEFEMLLRIQALLRRAQIAADRELVIGDTKLIYDSFIYIYRDEETTLPKKEFQLLFKLLSFPNKTFTRNQLMEEFWDVDSQSEERTVDVHINRLRERFKNNPDFEIITVRGLGYKAIRKDI